MTDVSGILGGVGAPWKRPTASDTAPSSTAGIDECSTINEGPNFLSASMREEELAARNEVLDAERAVLKLKNAALEAGVAELECSQSPNSSNSGKPPSVAG